MSLLDLRGRIGPPLLISLTLGLLAIQLVTDQPPLGGLGLILLLMPGFAVSQALGPRLLGWPEVLLTTLGAALALAVLSGVIAALSPRGLDASSVAAVEIVAMAVASTTWLVRLTGGDLRRVRPRIIVRPGSVLLLVAGLGLGTAGFIVALRGEQSEAQTSFVQLWSLPPASGGAQSLGLRNATGVGIDCQAMILRPGEPTYDLPIGAVADGQSWLGQLPQREGSGPGLWQISVHCAGADGSIFDRRLNVDPPA